MLMMRSQDRHLLWLLTVIGLFNIIDFFATQDLVTFGEHSEWNPLMRGLIGTPYFAVYKLVLIPLGILSLWFMRRAIVPKYIGLVRLVSGIYALLLVYTWTVFYA